MIKRDNFRILSEEEKSQYKFSFCENCEFYECELVGEYMQFKENNCIVSENPVPIVQATVIPADDCEFDKDTSIIKAQVYAADSFVSSTTEIISDMEFFPYSHNHSKNGCDMSKFNSVECGSVYVAEGIGEDFKINIRSHNFKIESDSDKWIPEKPNRWEPRQPVFISAQTGKGKNHFIENTLIPYVRDLNIEKNVAQKVLIISNRIALRLQVQDRLNGSIDTQDSEEATIRSYKEYSDVISYQSLLSMLDRLKRKQAKENRLSSYTFVVCDEAHFFTADAMFNHDTEKILYAIVNTFKDAIRIYMTATPYESLKYIRDYEQKYIEKSINGVLYHFKPDYSYLDVRYYSQHSELIDIIVKSVNSGKNSEKWLIFIDDIGQIEDFKSILDECNGMKGKVFAIDAKSKNNKTYQEMIKNEEFTGQIKVLLTTSVIDNGVNFRGIQNIVVSDMSKAKCLQMVGRARVANEDDKVTLYLKRFDEKYVEKRIRYLEKQQDAYHDYDLTARTENFKDKFIKKYYHGEEEDWKNASHWFGRQQGQIVFQDEIYPNEIARSLVKEFVESYRAILDEMKRTNKGRSLPGQKYLEYQLSWFGKKYDKSNDITLADRSKAIKEFIAFLESYATNEKYMGKEEQKIFSAKYTELFDRAFQRADKNEKRVYSLDKMNKLLKKLDVCYRVDSKRETKPPRLTYWVVVRFD